MRRCTWCVCALLATLAPFVQAQTPVALTKPDAELAEPFTQIAGVRELRDGRVIVVDRRDRTVMLVDFKAGTATRIGRTGAGPGEYANPSRIIALAGDSTAVHDPGNSRYLIVTPAGTLGTTFQILDAGSARMGGRGAAPRGTDARGRIYYEGSGFVAGRGGAIVPADSAPVIRLDRTTSKLDTLAYVQLAVGNSKSAELPGGGLMMQTGMVAFPARDDWAPMPDGGVAVVRVRDYHVDRIAPSGSRTSGAPVKFAPVAVTETEKEAWRVARREMTGPRSGRDGGSATSAPPPPPESEFPDFMPPFIASSAMVRPNAELWVLRSHKAADPPIYDVFSASGSFTGRVALAAKARLVGFGDGTAYVVRRDDDDLEYLQRYRIR